MQKKDGQQNTKTNTIPRAPVVVVMGHIDHGKSTLLDYIRKTNVAESEAGGITQNLSAYEVEVPQQEEPKSRENEENRGIPRPARDDFAKRKITFLDTPGHEAFSKMRERGAAVADIAILVVSAAEGVKPQTIEAWKTIAESQTHCIVAINKIDKPDANVEKTKKELAENEIYLENYGGKIPCAEISGKTGTGVDNLLSLILLLAEMEDFRGNAEILASGFVLEAHLDSKRGIQATLVIKDGSLSLGMTVVVENCVCSLRMLENFKGEMINGATFSAPVRIFGFDKMPAVGAPFKTFKNRQEALQSAEDWNEQKKYEPGLNKKAASSAESSDKNPEKKIIPILLKADVSGSLEAIEKEISKIKSKTEIQNAEFKIIAKGVGPVTESDIKNISDGAQAIIVGFNVSADKSALEVAEKKGITISFFDIIYKLTEWLEDEMERRRPRVEIVQTTGRAKIIRAFSRTKERQIVGGKVIEGQILLNGAVKIMRREFEIGRGKIVNLEKNKVKTSEVLEGSEFGMMIESKIEIAPGDIVELFSIEQK